MSKFKPGDLVKYAEGTMASATPDHRGKIGEVKKVFADGSLWRVDVKFGDAIEPGLVEGSLQPYYNMALMDNRADGRGALMPARYKPSKDDPNKPSKSIEMIPDAPEIASGTLEAGSEFWARLKAEGWIWTNDGQFSPAYWQLVEK